MGRNKGRFNRPLTILLIEAEPSTNCADSIKNGERALGYIVECSQFCTPQKKVVTNSVGHADVVGSVGRRPHV